MIFLLCLITAFCYVDCEDSEAFEQRVKYLEDLVTEEVKKAKSHKRPTYNRDILGEAVDAKPIDFGSDFDFIIVGGGTSGSVVANRLSENPKWTVLLLEAGDLNDEFTDMPFTFETSAITNRSWGYMSEGQKNGCKGRYWLQCPYPRGKILGGSGSINNLVYSRGIKEDFNKWVDAGNRGWSWDNVLPYYKKLEKYEAKKPDSRNRGLYGPVNVGCVKSKSVPLDAYLQANREMGFRLIEDYNAYNISGASCLQHNIQNGVRVSGANNYIKPLWNRTNFKMELRAFATKIVIDPKSRRATGVEFVKDNEKYVVKATKEVIISAGPVNSPQLLMLSGIGPKYDMFWYGLQTIQDLPVGKYLTDQILFKGLYFRSNHVEPTLSTNELVRKYLQGDPSLSQRGVTHFNSRYHSPLPNIELTLAAPVPTSLKFPKFENGNAEIIQFEKAVNFSTDWLIQLTLLHPKSTGNLRLRSKNPLDFPKINSGIFDNPEDLEDLYRGIEVALGLADTPTGRTFNLTLNIDLPSCPKHKFQSNPRNYWYCLLRLLALPANQIASTVKMGPLTDPKSCVNDELKVYGIQDLRVIDVSIAPTTITGHMNALAFLIGEKGADLIKVNHYR